MVKLLLKLQCCILCPYRHNQRHWTQSNIKITFSDSSFFIFNDLGCIPLEIKGGVGWGCVLPSNMLMEMYCRMESHFNDWVNFYGVAFLTELLEWVCTFLGCWGLEYSGN